MTNQRFKAVTRIIHNRRHGDPFGSPFSPTYSTTTYRFAKTDDLLDDTIVSLGAFFSF